MEVFRYVATEEGGTDRHAATDYTSAQLSRTENIRYRGYSQHKVDLREYIGGHPRPDVIFLHCNDFDAVYETGNRAYNGTAMQSV